MQKRNKSSGAELDELARDAAAIKDAAREQAEGDATPVGDDEADLIGELGADEDDTPPLRLMLAEALAGAPATPIRHAHLFEAASYAPHSLDMRGRPRAEAKTELDGERPFASLDAALARMEERRAHLARLFEHRGPVMASKDVARARAMANGEFVDEDWERLWDEMRDRDEKSLEEPPRPWVDSGKEDGPLHPIDELAAREAAAMDPGQDDEPDASPEPDPVSRFETAWSELKRWISGSKR